MKTVSAVVANRQFSAVLREVAQGARVTITLRGKPVATLAPVRARAAKRRLLKHLASVKVVGVGDWTRDELYD